MTRESIVKTTYDKIFKEDPLLLTGEKKSDYGKAMLNHLLLLRILTTTLPLPLDLLDDDTRESYRRTPKQRPPRPPDEFVNEYLKMRETRGKVSDPCFDVLSEVTMVSDGTNSERRATLDDRNHEKALKDFKKWKLKEDFEDRLRIAAIGYRVKVSRLEDFGYFDEELCMLRKVDDSPVPELTELPVEKEDSQLGRTKPTSPERVERWEKAIFAHIEKALDRKSKVICLPEFAFPSNRDRGATGPFTNDIRELCNRRSTEDHFLFAGTRHDERYNRGLILSKKQGELSKDWWHYKTASAKGLGENIVGPFGKNFPSYLSGVDIETQEASITVAVCYDTYDPTTFLKLVLDAMNAQEVGMPKIILVPSFNPNDDFVALLRDISFLGRCTVVYVNGLHGDAKMFVCGFALSDIATNYEYVMKTIDTQMGQLDDIIKEEKTKSKPTKRKKLSWGKAGAQISSPMEAKRGALRILQKALKKYHNNHTLDHIITVEECLKCRQKSHPTGDLHCDRDILYYNLNTGLIQEFVRFRQGYFVDESFLPEPFQGQSLRDALDKINESQNEKVA